MCGIAGLIARDVAAAERLDWVRAMVARLRHRGPSGDAIWADENCALGLARLAIVAPDQPARLLHDESGDVVGVANGEIYNHDALRLGLLARGHRLQAGPDTDVLPHLYEERGDELPTVLDGMFAIALWDRSLQSLLLARDRAGEKPLFYALDRNRLAFASEPGVLLALPWIRREPDPASLARYLVHGAFAGEDSAWAGIRQLPPGHTLYWRAGQTRVRRYWRPWDALVHDVPALSADEAPRRAAQALGEAVASRLPSDVPFGVFLSGGVDSGLVATLAARAWRRPFPTFSLSLPHRGYDESGYAARVAASIGSQHHVLTMTEREGEEALDAWGARMDQPLGDPSVLPTWALARLASRHVPVVLTGEGGDELFAGYPTYLGHRHAAVAERLPAPVARLLLHWARRLRPRHHHVTLAHLIERFLDSRGLPPFERHLAWWGTTRASEARALLHGDLRHRIDAQTPLEHARRLEANLRDMGIISNAGVPLVAYQLLDFETYLCGDLLTKVDRCTMAHGVESRAPFLRPSLIEWALSLPQELRLRGGSGKWALKQAARNLLPAEIVSRRKQGFSPPFSAWVRGPWRGLILDRLSPDRVAHAGVLDADRVQHLVRAHLDGHEDRGRTLWTVLSLQAWAEAWLHGDEGRAPAEPARAEALVHG